MNIPNLNKAFYNAATNGGQEKIANLAIDLGTFVRDRLREVSVIDKVLPPQYVTNADLQREESSNTYSMIVDKEPDSSAAVVNLSGDFKGDYVTGSRVKIPFTKVTSEEKSINVTELPSFTVPITKIIEDNQVRDIQIAKDTAAFQTVDGIIATTGADSLFAISSGLIDKAKFSVLKSLIDTNRLATDRVIMNIADFNDLMALDNTQLGDDLASQVFVDGYVFTKFMGVNLHVTTNSDVVKPGTIYAFAGPDFLGKQFVAQDTQFSIEKRHDVISWKMWQVLGIGFVNTKSVSRIRIYDSGIRHGITYT